MHIRLKSINAETLFYLARRLSNESHCRYWLDAKGDGSYSHVAIEFTTVRPEARLLSELEQYGFTLCFPSRTYRMGDAEGLLIRMEALRDMSTSKETRIVEGTNAGKSIFPL